MKSIIFGSNGGIGSAITKRLVASGEFGEVVAVSRSGEAVPGSSSIQLHRYDDESLDQLAQKVRGNGELTLCIVAIGTLSNDQGLRPERSYKQQSRDAFQQVFEANSIIPALIAKHLLPVMSKSRRTIFAALSARVGSIEDNRLGGWHAYRASKAALNMLIKNYAIEQRRVNPASIVVGLHPGTVDTELSGPFQANVPPGRLFSPLKSADFLLDVMEGLEPAQSGQVFDWAGKVVPP